MFDKSRPAAGSQVESGVALSPQNRGRTHRMLPWILIAIALVIGVFLVIVAMQPAEYRVTRAASIGAPPEAVFAQVNDFHNWDAWSPWAKLDPNATRAFEGSPAGAGAVFTWSGNKKIGEGKMTMAASNPCELIRINLEFIRPFPSSSTAEFTFKPEGDGNHTLVTWSMAGRKNFISKAFCMFMNMDKMIGGDFERGLSSMKAVSEGAGTIGKS
jgi:hypothetical protein